MDKKGKNEVFLRKVLTRANFCYNFAFAFEKQRLGHEACGRREKRGEKTHPTRTLTLCHQDKQRKLFKSTGTNKSRQRHLK